MFQDDTERIIRAAAYVEKHRALAGSMGLTDEEAMMIYEFRVGRFSQSDLVEIARRKDNPREPLNSRPA